MPAATSQSATDLADAKPDESTCPVPWCPSAACSAAACWVIAAADELPAGCPNRGRRVGPPDRLRRAIVVGDSHLTRGARGVLAATATGGATSAILMHLAEGRLIFLEPRTPRPLKLAPSGRRKPIAAPLPVSTPDAGDKTSWIKLRVVADATGEPLAGVKLSVTQPNGKTFDYATRPDGAVEVHGIDPGACDVASPLDEGRVGDTYDFVEIADRSTGVGEAKPAAPADEAAPSPTATGDKTGPEPTGGPPIAPPIAGRGVRIARVEVHKVRTGESIKSLAESNGLTWQQLALFNWYTEIPDEINVKLRDEVGCTKKAPDGVNYRFDDADDPGIVYIPTLWNAKGLATDQTHTIRVRGPLGDAAQINYIRLCVYHDDEKPAGGLGYAIRDAVGAAVCAGETDAQGRIRYDNVALQDFDLEIAGHDRTIPAVAYDDEWVDVFLPWSGFIRLIVHDATEKPAAEQAYEIRNADGKQVASGSTDADGRIRVERTPLGDYELTMGAFKRTIPAVGYDDEWVDVFLPADGGA